MTDLVSEKGIFLFQNVTIKFILFLSNVLEQMEIVLRWVQPFQNVNINFT